MTDQERIAAVNTLAQALRIDLAELSEAGQIDVGVAVVALCDVLGDMLADSPPAAFDKALIHIRRRMHRAAKQTSPIAAPTLSEVVTHG